MLKNILFLFSITAALLSLTALSYAQGANGGYLNRAAQLFAEKKYYDAAQYYEKYLGIEKKGHGSSQPFAVQKKHKGNSNIDPHQLAVYNLAECYRMLNNYEAAEKWYAMATKFPTAAFPATQYWYGVSLRANKKYAAAIEAITNFIQNYKPLDDLLVGADRELENLKFIQLHATDSIQGFRIFPKASRGNTSSYAVTQYNNDTIAFTGIHEDMSMDKKSTVYKNALYVSGPSSDSIMEGNQLKLENITEQHAGLATFSANGKKMFFTQWTLQNGKKTSAIYSSTKNESGWSKPQLLEAPINIEGYNSAQPSIADDGRFLLFVSDRPGGVGKWDIWFASLDTAYNILTVKNMGNTVNTAQDEQSPYYHSNSRTLVFSSNGHIGMGGYDIFYSRGTVNLADWEKPVNPGPPINSAKDDVYFISTDKDNLWNEGWLSSDRSSTCCLAMFEWKQNNAQFISGNVSDCTNGKGLNSVKLTVTAFNHPEHILANVQTDSAGHYNFNLTNTSRFRITAEKEGYGKKTDSFLIHINTTHDSLTTQLCLQAVLGEKAEKEVKKTLEILSKSTTVGNFAYKKASLTGWAHSNLDSLATLMKTYPTIIVQIEGYTDAIGSDKYNLELSQARVNACIKYLVKKGIDKRRLIGKAFGKCCPIEPDIIDGKDNPAGREKNRRVEYKLIKPEAGAGN